MSLVQVTEAAVKKVKPLLVFSYGNPARGDDALGPLLTDQLADWLSQSSAQNPLGERVEILTDYQLQIEHVTDLYGREQVVFVDASVSCPQPYRFRAIQAEDDASYTTHALKPQALLQVYEQVYQQVPPPCYLLEIRGYHFELGEALSKGAALNLGHALVFVQSNCLTDQPYDRTKPA
ncbi:MAG: hydrogenase maturation protease [Thiolinea sp.]